MLTKELGMFFLLFCFEQVFFHPALSSQPHDVFDRWDYSFHCLSSVDYLGYIVVFWSEAWL